MFGSPSVTISMALPQAHWHMVLGGKRITLKR
jgi:hypothetical protein